MLPTSINSNVVEAPMQVQGGKYYSPNAQHSNYLLVQFKARLHLREYEQIHSINLRTTQYLSGNTYLCYYRSADLDLVRSLSFVVYANVYHPDYVVQEHLKNQINQDLQTSSSASDQTYLVNVALHSQDLVAHAKPHIAEILHVPEIDLEFQGANLIIDLAPLQFHPIAALEQVLSIQKIAPLAPQLFQARRDIGLPKDSTPLIFGRDALFSQYRGENQVIAFADSGICGGYARIINDKANAEIVYQGVGHAAFGDRILDRVNVNRSDTIPPTPRVPTETFARERWARVAQDTIDRGAGRFSLKIGPASSAEAILQSPGFQTSDMINSHGTHVVSCAVGRGYSVSYGAIQGVAPKASAIMYCLTKDFEGTKNPSEDIYNLLKKAYDHPQRPKIHNDSIAPDTFDKLGIPSGYEDNRSAGADRFVWERQDMLVVVAAGNMGHVAKTVWGQVEGFAIAKNVLTVGACETSHPLAWITKHQLDDKTAEERAADKKAAEDKKAADKKAAKEKKDGEERKDGDERKLDEEQKSGGVQVDEEERHLGFLKSSPVGNPGRVAYFSNRGPAYTGNPNVDQAPFRWKPDVVAPGVAILGAKAKNTFGVGRALGMSKDDEYFFNSGTSFSAPMVSGAAALIRQAVIQRRSPPFISAALLKAIIINTADDISTVRAHFVIPNPKPLPADAPPSTGIPGTGTTGTGPTAGTGIDTGIGLGPFSSPTGTGTTGTGTTGTGPTAGTGIDTGIGLGPFSSPTGAGTSGSGTTDTGTGFGPFPSTTGTGTTGTGTTGTGTTGAGSSGTGPARFATTGRNPAVNPAPDAYQGFGRINVLKALDLVAGMKGNFLDDIRLTAQITTHLPADPTGVDTPGSSTSFSVPIPATDSTLAVTMCYADEPGTSLVNVLSVQAEHETVAGRIHYGNEMACQGLPRPLGRPDESNNVQKILWTGVDEGNVRVKVWCSRISATAMAPPPEGLGLRFAVAWMVTPP